ncbi:hypothetical protein Hanom_Chr10g00964051 [Helianthus anomalus]
MHHLRFILLMLHLKKRSFDSRMNFTISSYTIYFSLLSFHIRKGLHISHTRFSILVSTKFLCS